jgi:hypothetical protein
MLPDHNPKAAGSKAVLQPTIKGLPMANYF